MTTGTAEVETTQKDPTITFDFSSLFIQLEPWSCSNRQLCSPLPATSRIRFDIAEGKADAVPSPSVLSEAQYPVSKTARDLGSFR